MSDCPYCAEPVGADAAKCPHCGEYLVERPGQHLERPVAVTVFAALNGAAGALCLLLVLLQGFNVFMLLRATGSSGLSLLGVVAAGALVYGVAGASLVALAIGMWQLKPWARTLALGCSGLAAVIFLLILGVGVYAAAAGPGGGIEALIIAGVTGSIGLTYWVAQLIVMTRPNIAAAFSPR